MTESLQLGAVANLLLGFKPTWNPNAGELPFYAPAAASVTLHDAAPIATRGDWKLRVTLHPAAETLVSALHPWHVESGEVRGDVPSGPLMLRDADSKAARAAVGRRVGVALEGGYSYMLAQWVRVDGERRHSVQDGGLSPQASLSDAAVGAAQTLLSSLHKGKGAEGYLRFFAQFGTHYVSRISYGEIVSQVFAYAPEKFVAVSKEFTRLAGGAHELYDAQAAKLRHYSSEAGSEEGSAGFAAHVGPILCATHSGALARTRWKDGTYELEHSVFAAYEQANGQPLDQLTASGPVAFALTGLEELIQGPRRPCMAHLVCGALAHKYGPRVTARPADTVAPQWTADYPSPPAPWLTVMATPTVSVFHDRMDLTGLRLASAGTVDSFTAVAHLLEVRDATPVALPGRRVRLVAHTVNTCRSAEVPTLKVPDATLDTALTCDVMRGALRIQATDSDRHHLLLDGLRFSTAGKDEATGRDLVRVDAVPAVPRTSELAALTTSFQLSLLTAESLLGTWAADDAVAKDHTTAYLEWLAACIPAATADKELLALRLGALTMARTALAVPGHTGTAVPFLKHTNYRELNGLLLKLAGTLQKDIKDYAHLAEQRRAEQQRSTETQQIGASIQQTARILAGYVRTMAQHQKDLVGYQRTTADKLGADFDAAVTQAGRLHAELATRHEKLREQAEKYRHRVAEFGQQQSVKAVLTVGKALFDLVVTVASPAKGIGATKELMPFFQNLQKLINVAEAVGKVSAAVTDVTKQLKKADDALKAAKGPGRIELPSDAEWRAAQEDFEVKFASVPEELKADTEKLKTAFRLMVIAGRAWVEALGKQARLRREYEMATLMTTVQQRQDERLAAVPTAVRTPADGQQATGPDVDLIGLAGAGQFQLQQTLAQLARVVVAQGASISYTYLTRPPVLRSLDLSSLIQTLIAQQGLILSGERLDPKPTRPARPIEVSVRVPAARLFDGECRIPIPLDAPEFRGCARVRVERVSARIDGLENAEGTYRARVVFLGAAFQDRDVHHDIFTFSTVDRHFGPYDYYRSGQEWKAGFKEDTGAIQGNVTPVTPFGTWRVQLPDDERNRLLRALEPTVTVTLSFEVTRLAQDIPTGGAGHRATWGSGFSAVAPAKDLRVTVVADMHHKGSVLHGWDAVFSMSVDKVNEILKAQYKERNPGTGTIIETYTYGLPFKSPDGKLIVQITHLSLTLGAPTVSFKENKSGDVTFTQPITKGTVGTGSMYVPDTRWKPARDSHQAVKEWTTAPVPASTDQPKITATIPLAKVRGSTKDDHEILSVCLEVGKGEFRVRNIQTGNQGVEIDSAVLEYFRNNPVVYTINSINLQKISTLAALKPSSFKIATKTFDFGREVLQLFITTNGTERSELSTKMDEPIPATYDCSLVISSKILFNDIIAGGFGAGSGFTAAVTKPDDEVNGAWSASINGSFSVELPFKTVEVGFNRHLQISIGGDDDPEFNDITFDLKDLTFRGGEEGKLTAELKKTTKNQKFYYRTLGLHDEIISPYPGGNIRKPYVDPWQPSELNFEYSISVPAYGLTVTRKPNQKISVSNPTVVPTVTIGKIASKGACDFSSSADYQEKFADHIRNSAPGALKKAVEEFAFKEASVFALENLLFPAEQRLTLTDVYTPGDLLILGRLDSSQERK